MRTFARELVALQPDVMFAVPTPAVDALLKETRTIPIVFANISDPIGSGFAASLARPGSNVTGFSNFEATLGGKWLEMLKEIAPNATRVAVVFNPKTAVDSGRFFLRPIEAAASRIMNELIALPFDNAVDVKHAITQFSVVPNGAMLLLPDASNSRHRILITDLAAQYHLPAIYPERRFAIGGGLVSYGVNAVDLYRRSATYVDRILKGAKPEDLPIQQPTTFELVINLKTANALGLTVPPMLLARADEVIE
jgi:putative tryptophan/tyrosine transport system substrate-binding protein